MCALGSLVVLRSMVTETIRAAGHQNVSAHHSSTFEVTTDSFLTPAGDCIIGINATKAPADFSTAFVESCRSRTTTIVARIAVENLTMTITGSGHPDLTLSSSRSLVGRTSEYIDDRTVMINADTAAGSIDRALVDFLTDGADLVMTLDARTE